MNDMMKKLMERKAAEGKKMSPLVKKAKSKVLSDLISDMDAEGADKVRGIKKVTVAAPDQEGLEKGLEKAKEIVGEAPEMMDEESEEECEHGEDEMCPHCESAEHEEQEASKEELAEHEAKDEMGRDEIMAKIAELQAQLESLK